MNRESTNASKEQKNDLEFRLISPSGEEFEVLLDVPKHLLEYKLAASQTDLVKSKAADMLFHHHAGKGFDVWLSNYDVRQTTTIIGKANRPVLEWHNAFDNSFKSTWDGIILPEPRSHQYNMSYTPFVNNKAEFIAGRKYTTCDFHFTDKFLAKYAPHYPILDKFLNEVDKGKRPASLSTSINILPDSIRMGMERIVNFDLPEGLAAEFFDAQVKILLMEMLATLSAPKVNKIKYTRSQTEGTRNARDYIVNNLSEDLSIETLAQKAALSEALFKNCFTDLFGIPPHKYVIEQRLKHAARLLRDPKITNATISDAIGLSDPNYFYPFFKKFYGMTPDEWRTINKKLS
jgi:AraC-like DNA-binding protein